MESMTEQEYYSELYAHQQGDGGEYVQSIDTGKFSRAIGKLLLQACR